MSACFEQGAPADRDRPVLELEDHPARALGGLEGEPERLAVARVALDAVDLVELLLARLGLPRPRAGAEAGHEALHAGDLGALLVDRAAQRELAGGLLAAPLVPGAGEEAPAPALELEHRGPDRLEEPAVVRDEHDGRVEALEALLEPLERRDVEVVRRLVEEQEVGVAREGPGERGPRELAAGEGAEVPVEVGVGEAEAGEPARDLVAPRVAARVLELGLGARVRVERRVLDVALGHPAFELGEPRLDVEELGARREDVVAQGHPALARRALVVQGDLRPLGEGQLAAVDRGLAGQHRAGGSSCPSRCGPRGSAARGARA